ncbi:MAG: nitroreductase family protein [Ruminococcus sp.]|uniref:nitroreductase family protein n=1 Tax=Ruminococcus sp. TaxID=41978 RepID=UPI002872C8D5|nr:nitroreductase family protein [Ruminococcus sp.]MBQ3284803.1 nitroreductase family protein [Ruminococcus sp.]
MTELQAIRERHSVRAYQKKPIEPELARALQERIGELNERYDLHMQYIEPAGAVFSAFTNRFTGFGNVPAYIAMIGKRSDDLDERCGYVGEQLVLYAQTLGLNTCWAGMFKRRQVTAEIGEGEKLALVIAVGYGVNGGRPRRSKKIEEVTDVQDMPEWFKKGVEAALLAPTAVNQQKFFFTLDGDTPSVKVSANGPFVKLDLGIVKYHFEVGSGRKID